MMDRDPEIALRKANALPDDDRKQLLPSMGSKAADEGRDFAEGWLANFPVGSLAHQQTLGGICIALPQSDPAWAVDLIEKFPSEISDEVEGRWAESVAGSKPETTLERIVEVRDADLRNRLLVSAIDSWRKNNPGRANTWVEQAGLPAKVLEALQETGE